MEQQLSLLGGLPREKQAVTEDQIVKQPTPLAAIRASIYTAGLDPKEIYLPLGIDKATWSKTMDGHPRFSFPFNKIENLLDLTKNEVPLIWLAYRRGFRLVPILTEHERQLSDLKRENEELKAEIRTLAKYGVIRKP